MERARTECLRKRGIELDVWQDQHRRIFVVRRVNVDFKQPARFNEQITVSAKIMTVNRASMELSQHVFREDNVLCTAKVELACVDADTLRPTRIPVTIKEALACEH